jgi:hypothetical protein
LYKSWNWQSKSYTGHGHTSIKQNEALFWGCMCLGSGLGRKTKSNFTSFHLKITFKCLILIKLL